MVLMAFSLMDALLVVAEHTAMRLVCGFVVGCCCGCCAAVTAREVLVSGPLPTALFVQKLHLAQHDVRYHVAL